MKTEIKNVRKYTHHFEIFLMNGKMYYRYTDNLWKNENYEIVNNFQELEINFQLYMTNSEFRKNIFN